MMVGSTASPVPALSRATPLPFTGHPIVISVHPYIRAALQEVGRFGAGGHLRAVLAAVATECGRLASGPGRKRLKRADGHVVRTIETFVAILCMSRAELWKTSASLLPPPGILSLEARWNGLSGHSCVIVR
jgi:hypothetical protein